MREHPVEGFRATAAPYEVFLTTEKAQLLIVDAHAVVQDQVTEEYELAVDIEKI